MESESYNIIRGMLPKHWVVRDFNHPDYGVDLVIEIFEPISESEKEYEAMGEFIYVQVKSVMEVSIDKKKLYPVMNVAKGIWKESKGKYIEAALIRHSIDTTSLHTVEQMGSSICFLLFLVDIKNKEVYFICLNDLIDKFIKPKNSNYLSQGHITILLPALNALSNQIIGPKALKSFGKRAKLLAAFAKFFYQRNEILHHLNMKEMPVSILRDEHQKAARPNFNELMQMIRYFVSQIEHLDIWRIADWHAIDLSKTELTKLVSLLNSTPLAKGPILDQIMITWHSLCNLGYIYEELVREWYLPKNLSYYLSYPDDPQEFKD